jgi:hypothetical protein
MKSTITAKTALIIAEELQYSACVLVKKMERLEKRANRLAIEYFDSASFWWMFYHYGGFRKNATVKKKIRIVADDECSLDQVDSVMTRLGFQKEANHYKWGEQRKKANDLTTKLRACAAYGDPVYLTGDEAEFIYELIGEL